MKFARGDFLLRANRDLYLIRETVSPGTVSFFLWGGIGLQQYRYGTNQAS